MRDINEIISDNLKLFRKQNGYSLDDLAEVTNVSKTMLSQIERKASSPSINTLWKIANGLKVTLSEMTQENSPIIKKTTFDDIEPIISENQKYKIYPYFKFDMKNKFEAHMAILDPGGTVEEQPHGSGSKEYIIVYEGVLTLTLDGEQITLRKDEAISFNANIFYRYANKCDERVKIYRVIHY